MASGSDLVYLDSSALVKLVVAEAETAALRGLSERPQRVSSTLARVEVLRAVKRNGLGPAVRQRTVRVLQRVALVRADETVLQAAARLAPRELRTLDAIHQATAQSLPSLAGLATYDRRMAEAATGEGLGPRLTLIRRERLSSRRAPSPRRPSPCPWR